MRRIVKSNMIRNFIRAKPFRARTCEIIKSPAQWIPLFRGNRVMASLPAGIISPLLFLYRASACARTVRTNKSRCHNRGSKSS